MHAIEPNWIIPASLKASHPTFVVPHSGGSTQLSPVSFSPIQNCILDPSRTFLTQSFLSNFRPHPLSLSLREKKRFIKATRDRLKAAQKRSATKNIAVYDSFYCRIGRGANKFAIGVLFASFFFFTFRCSRIFNDHLWRRWEGRL